MTHEPDGYAAGLGAGAPAHVRTDTAVAAAEGVAGRAAPPHARPRVAFQGDHGAYSEEAVAVHWRGEASAIPSRECADVAAAVERGAAEYGLLPIENTLAGSVAATYDALAEAAGVVVVGEVVLPIHHCLLALPGATLESLTVVESHPIALAQCRRFLARHPQLEAYPAYDTAGAARQVAARGDARHAAIASRAAAAHFGLAVLATSIEDRPDNRTRFLAVACEPAVLPGGVPARTALLATTENVPGALLRLLEPVAGAGLNLSTIESRPTGTPWTYRFFLEVEHAAGDPRLAAVLHALRSAATSLRVLGTFARSATPPVAAGTADDHDGVRRDGRV